jgi:hypothetical protein
LMIGANFVSKTSMQPVDHYIHLQDTQTGIMLPVKCRGTQHSPIESKWGSNLQFSQEAHSAGFYWTLLSASLAKQCTVFQQDRKFKEKVYYFLWPSCISQYQVYYFLWPSCISQYQVLWRESVSMLACLLSRVDLPYKKMYFSAPRAE